MKGDKRRDIRDILLHDETLFRNMHAFDPDYVPENYRYRESQMEALAVCIRPALRNGRPVNAVILGSCATGKTTAIKKIFEMAESTSESVVCCYINCQLHTTRFGIFSQIYSRIFGHQPPETGVPFSRIYQAIMQHLASENRALVVALDDINHLFYSKNANKVLYDILRAHEVFEGVRTGVFAVLSDIEFRYALDKNVDSIFIPQEIVFPPYTREEVFNILRDRVRVGFYPGVISDELIERITDHTMDTGDLRYGIDLLRVCGNLAEADASPMITGEHLERAIKSTGPVNLIHTVRTLNENEREFLRILADAGDDITAGALYELFRESTGSSYSSFNRIIEKLEFLRLIDTRLTGKGVRGNSRILIPRFSREDLGRCPGF
ncbi:AAA family ATPase [Methanothermobacter thermautotrophicus]|jgi:cell division control protein 6|uniref:ORC1-type DNA replication protein n=1 Tax=Methanothermobacter thermautotrophicus TaxID=145262 RepID=A0A842YKH6_METTF|nr:ORC1-type DNA replication protein Cdc6-2 [Methanothermobacter thermautotrophicus]MBE2899839.1 AAA family ATPase [Methanothermobacter thermautotrophicus]